MKVLSFGEILWDIIAGKNYLGGAPFNYAAHLAQCGAEVQMISRLGKDQLGTDAFAAAQKLGVGTNFIQWDEQKPTGTVDVFLDNGQPSYTIHPDVAYDFLDFEALKTVGLLEQTFDVFAFGTLAQRDRASRACLYAILEKMKFKHIFYDVNLRKDCYTPENVKTSLAYSTMLKLNDEEVVYISSVLFDENHSIEAFCRKVAVECKQELIIVTAGAKGCYVFYEEKLHFVESKKVTVADTVGAGDSFSAVFTYTFFHSGDPMVSARAANLVGGFVASSHGPIPNYSSEIKAVLGIKK